MTVLLVSALRGIGSESSRLEALEAFRTASRAPSSPAGPAGVKTGGPDRSGPPVPVADPRLLLRYSGQPRLFLLSRSVARPRIVERFKVARAAFTWAIT